jgi:hypothetical protein
MLKKDYIQRHLDELVKMIAKVLLLQQNNEPEKANFELDQFGETYLKINLNQLIEQNPASIINELIEKQNFEITHFKILEELLYQKYLIAPSNNKLKSLTLTVLNYLSNIDKDFSIARKERIDQLT